MNDPDTDDDWPDVGLPDWAEPQKGSDVHRHEHDPEFARFVPDDDDGAEKV